MPTTAIGSVAAMSAANTTACGQPNDAPQLERLDDRLEEHGGQRDGRRDARHGERRGREAVAPEVPEHQKINALAPLGPDAVGCGGGI